MIMKIREYIVLTKGQILTRYNLLFSIKREHQDVGFTSLTILLLVHQIGSALDHIHNVGVIHRDVKMENILLGAGNRFRQLDIIIRYLQCKLKDQPH